MSKTPMQVLSDGIHACQQCFRAPEVCRHHEDLLGGYDEGKVLLVAINPQGGLEDEFYKRVEKAPANERMMLGDHILRIFAGEAAPADLPKHLYTNHPGRQWVKRAASCLGYSLQQFAANVRVADLYKHTTANQAELQALDNFSLISANCRSWFAKQLPILNPSLVILTGAPGLAVAREVFAVPDLPRKVTTAHGRVWHVRQEGGWSGPVLVTLAISLQTAKAWNGPGRRQQVAEAIGAGVGAAKTDASWSR
jgi:hypothetical protein